MRSTKQFSITLANEMAEAVRAMVATGEYATENEVTRNGLRVLLAPSRLGSRLRARTGWLWQGADTAMARGANPRNFQIDR